MTLTAGQMVEITSEIPPGGYQSQATPSDVQHASMSSTDVPDLPLPAVAGVRSPWHWVLLMGAFAGAAVGLTFAVDRGTTTRRANPGLSSRRSAVAVQVSQTSSILRVANFHPTRLE